MKYQPDWTFQFDAVKNITKDFYKNPYAKKLLVIPTGGGKTIVAFKSVDKMIKNGFIDSEHKVMWIVHTKWLKSQTIIKLKSEFKRFNFSEKIFDLLEIRMKTEAIRVLENPDSINYRLLIIDEAHHSAANTYSGFFRPDVGVLGLTATPTRTDDMLLDFEDISYSITFRELVRRRVILLPIFEKIKTNININTRSLNYYKNNLEMNKFNINERNEFIANAILKRKNKYSKVVIFVATKDHCRNLYKVLKRKNEFYNEPFKQVGYICGGNENEENMDNDVYLEKYENFNSSILVNCLILNEGYDDKKVNAVVMATPSKSILYYMQCVGRVVRNPGKHFFPKAHVLELVDNLPHIHYHIDNRWLFSEISDYLEPIVVDKKYRSERHLDRIMQSLFKKNKLKDKYKNLATDQYHLYGCTGLLLVSDVDPKKQEATWKAIVFTKNYYKTYTILFNKLSANINRYHNFNGKYLIFSKMRISKNDPFFSNRIIRQTFLSALERAWLLKKNNTPVDCLKYYTFTYKSLWSIIYDFIINLFNKFK